MNWNFDDIPARDGTQSVKYDRLDEVFGRHDIIPMWVADMDFRTPEFIIGKLKNRLDHEILGYSFRPHEYFDAIQKWFRERHRWETDKEWICFSPGIVPALNLCTLAFTGPGDSIIVQPPVYFPFFSAVEGHDRKLIYNPLVENKGRWEMDFNSLLRIINRDTKMIIISNPHNPVGRAWTRGELSRLADICNRHGIIIVSDEIHCDLVLPGYSHTALATVSEEASRITVTCVAPSKTFNLAGLSTSSVIIKDPALRDKFTGLTGKLHIDNGNIFGTAASIAAYSEGADWVNALNEYINGNVAYVIRYMKENIPEIVAVRPEATYMIWLDCRKLSMSGKELRDFFVNKAGIGMNEGSSFGPGGEGFMRMNLATSRKVITTAMEQIKRAVAELRPAG